MLAVWLLRPHLRNLGLGGTKSQKIKRFKKHVFQCKNGRPWTVWTAKEIHKLSLILLCGIFTRVAVFGPTIDSKHFQTVLLGGQGITCKAWIDTLGRACPQRNAGLDLFRAQRKRTTECKELHIGQQPDKVFTNCILDKSNSVTLQLWPFLQTGLQPRTSVSNKAVS